MSQTSGCEGPSHQEQKSDKEIEELKGDEKAVNEAELKDITSDNMGEEVGQKDIESLTARVDDMGALFVKTKGEEVDTNRLQARKEIHALLKKNADLQKKNAEKIDEIKRMDVARDTG